MSFRPKQFRIVQVVETWTSGDLRTRYQVQHRVRILGLDLWWCGVWWFDQGGMNDNLWEDTLPRARMLQEKLQADYRVAYARRHATRTVMPSEAEELHQTAMRNERLNELAASLQDERPTI